MKQAGFTLVELLIIIGVIAILATTAVVILNPAELIARGRDTKRVSDIDSLDKSLGVYEVQGGSFTNIQTDTVYISLPAPNTNCTGVTPAYDLPTLPSGWTYHCVEEANLRKVDGNGWIPIDFTTTAGLSLGTLPIDPKNTDTNQLYYTFIMGSYNLTAKLESNKVAKRIGSKDNGVDPIRYEAGTIFSGAPSGLVGYWPLDEGSGATGTIIADKSPDPLNGTIKGLLTPHYGSECINRGCLETNQTGTQNYV